MESEEFLLLPVNQLVDVISSDEVNVRTEEQVFNACMAWVRYNVQERKQCLSTVSFLHSFICIASVQHRPRYRVNYALTGQMSPFFPG